MAVFISCTQYLIQAKPLCQRFKINFSLRVKLLSSSLLQSYTDIQPGLEVTDYEAE